MSHLYALLGALAMAASIACGVSMGIAIGGPSDTEAAQDVADDSTGAALLAEQAAECQRLFGADAEVFVLENLHTVCRPPASFTTGITP